MDNQRKLPTDQFWQLLSKKLANEATPEELNELQIILLNHPDLLPQMDLLTEMWKQQPTLQQAEGEAAFMRHLMKFKEEFFAEETAFVKVDTEEPVKKIPFYRSKNRILYFSIAALFILSIGSFILFSDRNAVKSQETNGISSVVTKNGNRTKIVLADGTQVWLNAGSSLDYDNLVFNRELREVTLNGEAYFDVTKNPGKPFLIHTQKMDIKVLGTAFNVRSYSNEKTAEAALIRGTIEVTLKDRKNQKIILKPNEKISIANDLTPAPLPKNGQRVNIKTVTPSIPQIVVKEIKPNPTYNIIGEIAWIQNKLFFEDERLEDIALKIERWFGKKVAIINDQLKNVHYYGNYENETLEEVLSSLKLSYPFNFKIENNTVVIY
jgi:ferric-dicitrate binding protein FerR (iron transport regulator)